MVKMKRRFNRTQRNYIIAGLCMILVIMGVGYAAFSSQLKISGTSNITSNWSVKITDIQSKVVSGTPANASAPTHTDTTATFRTTLTSPGDTMQYDVTVLNEGDIDAKLDKITVPESTNPAIGFEVKGIEEGSLLEAKQTALLTVTVKYNDVTEQPSDLTADLEVTLDYSQAPEGYVPPAPSGIIGGQKVELVESGDGLYEDSYEAGRLIYRGQDPNNYITFNGETWRIIAKETDGTYKIIRDDVLESRVYDEANHRSTANNSYCDNPSRGCGVYAAVSGTFSSPSGSQSGTVTEDSSIKIYLNEDYYTNNINSTAKGQMISHSFNIGAVEYLDESGAGADSIEKNIAGEKMYQWTGNVGLANVSDILRASTNPLCTSATDQGIKIQEGQVTCNSNYLFEIPDSTGYWTINAYSGESGGNSRNAWIAVRASGLVGVANSYAFLADFRAPRPVVFLKSDTTLNGNGTSEDPFTIAE